jgi:hypothetical protein
LDSQATSGPDAREHVEAVLGGHLEETAVSTLIELWSFMRERKKFWLLPIFLMMIVLGGLLILTKISAVAPFIYTLF